MNRFFILPLLLLLLLQQVSCEDLLHNDEKAGFHFDTGSGLSEGANSFVPRLGRFESAAMYAVTSSVPNIWLTLAEILQRVGAVEAATTYIVLARLVDPFGSKPLAVSKELSRDRFSEFSYWTNNIFIRGSRVIEHLMLDYPCIPHELGKGILGGSMWFAASADMGLERRSLSNACICAFRSAMYRQHVGDHAGYSKAIAAAAAMCERAIEDRGISEMTDTFLRNNDKILTDLDMHVKKCHKADIEAARQAIFGDGKMEALMIVPPREMMVAGGMHFVNGFLCSVTGLHEEALIYLSHAINEMEANLSPSDIGAQSVLRVTRSFFAVSALHAAPEKAQKMLDLLASDPAAFFAKELTRPQLQQPKIQPKIQPKLPLEKSERYQSLSFRNGSAEWKEAIDRYESQHLANAPMLPDDSPRRIPTDGRYLIAQIPWDVGIGNRLVSVVSLFVMALLTNRTMLVHWDARSLHYKGEGRKAQALEAMWSLPHSEGGGNAFEWNYVRFIAGMSAEDIALIERAPRLQIYENTASLPDVTRMACSWSHRDADAQFLWFGTNVDVTAIAAASPLYKEIFEKLTGQYRMSLPAMYLLRPSLPIDVATRDFISKYLPRQSDGSHRPYSLGIHLRTSKEGDEDSWWEGLLPVSRHQPGFRDELRKFMIKTSIVCTRIKVENFLSAWRSQGSPEHLRPVVFVASDSPRAVQEYSEILKKDFPEVLTVSFDASSHDILGSQYAAADMWLLSHCSVIQRGGRKCFSLFSTVAGLIGGGNTPWCSVQCTDSGGPECDEEWHGEPRLGLMPQQFYRIALDCPQIPGGANTIIDGIIAQHAFFPVCSEFSR